LFSYLQSSLEALEVVSSTLPVDLIKEEIAIRQLGKINSYKNTIPIKRRLEVWKEIEEPERHITTSKNVPASRRYENNRKYRC
jgi:hypothetical protein